MMHLLPILGDAALMAAVSLLLFLFALMLRNPLKPKWLDVDEIGVLAALIITAALAFAFTAFVRTLINAGIGFSVALITGVVFWAAVSVALWALLRMSDRLKACEAGRSPFWLSDTISGTPPVSGGDVRSTDNAI